MSVFTKENSAARTYTELLQKKAGEKVENIKKEAEGYKESLAQLEKKFQEKSAELQQIADNLASLQEQKLSLEEQKQSLEEQKADLQFLKEKQDFVLRNFPTLEGNVVEKLKIHESNNTHALMQRLEEMERVAKKRNAWNKVLLWFSLLFSIAATGGVAVVLLYLADVIVF